MKQVAEIILDDQIRTSFSIVEANGLFIVRDPEGFLGDEIQASTIQEALEKVKAAHQAWIADGDPDFDAADYPHLDLALGFNMPCGFNTVHFRHGNVHYHDIRLDQTHLFKCLLAVGRLADNQDARLAGNPSNQPCRMTL